MLLSVLVSEEGISNSGLFSRRSHRALFWYSEQTM